jgi:2-polyprenyl-6-methoxyphenol hydroxylase-like FAD-dependent oxidoreductase
MVLGKRAVVIGAGIGGLSAARAAADAFEEVVVLERDELPADAAQRAGVPQGRHAHALLAGGQRALEELFPGLTGDLEEGGAVRYRIGLDNRLERPGYDPFPQRDLGWDAHAMSRPLLEGVARRRLLQHPGVRLRTGCRADQLVGDGTAVTGVRCESADGREELIAADLVVDASGRGALTLALLAASGRPPPDEDTIGVDFGYATGIFAIPEDAPTDWKLCITLPEAPKSTRIALMLPVEGRRWILSLGGRQSDKPPGDWQGFMAFARGLRTATLGDAISRARPLGEVARFGFPASVRRHFERCSSFPRGLLPIGDAICRFNPIYGQGMSVAAQQGRLLGRLLAAGSLDVGERFLLEAQAIIDTPWATAALPDLAYPATEGVRPPDFAASLTVARALNQLAAEDPAVHRLTAEVQHLLQPRSAYANPELRRRIQALMPATA